MAGKKDFPLSITLRAIDRATAGVRKVFAGIRNQVSNIGGSFRQMGRKFAQAIRETKLSSLSKGFANVRDTIGGIVTGLAGLAGAAGLSLAGLKALVDEGDELGAIASRLGLSVDALAQLRFAAEKSDVEVGEFDAALGQLSKRLGEMKAGGGSLDSFLKKVSPSLRKQVKAAKNSEEAINLLADAMVKLKDPTKRAALANAAFGRGGAPLINMLANGSAGITELKRKFFELAGSQEGFANASGKIDDKLKDLKASLFGVRGSVVTSLAPAFIQLADRVTQFFTTNRGRIQEWIRDFGDKLPARIDRVIGWMKNLGSVVGFVLDHVKEIAVLFGAFKVGGLIGEFSSAGGVLGTFAKNLGAAVAGLGALAAGAMAAAAWIDRNQSERQDAEAQRKSMRESLIGKFAGTGAAFRRAQEEGLIGADGRIDRGRVRDALLTGDDRFREAGGTQGASRRAEIDHDLDRAMASLSRARGAAAELGPKNAFALRNSALAAIQTVNQGLAKITVEFKGAPPSTRVKTEAKRGAAKPSVKVGYQTAPAEW